MSKFASENSIKLQALLTELERVTLDRVDRTDAASNRDKKSLRLAVQTHCHLLRRTLDDVERLERSK